MKSKMNRKRLAFGITSLFVITVFAAGIIPDFDEQDNKEMNGAVNDCILASVQDNSEYIITQADVEDELISIRGTIVDTTGYELPGEEGLPMDHFAETGDTGGRVFHLWDLASAKPKNFPKIFARSIDPDIPDFRGCNFSGIVLYVKNLYLGKMVFTAYTGKLQDVLTGKMYSQALTFQKRFFPEDNSNGESGINYWPVLAKESMAMKIYLSPSIQNKSIFSLKIDYDVDSNKRLTQRPLIDEVRQIPDSNLYIGKMYYRLAGKPILFLWFAIERENYAE